MNAYDIEVQIRVPGWRARVAEFLFWLGCQILARGLIIETDMRGSPSEPGEETPVGIFGPPTGDD